MFLLVTDARKPPIFQSAGPFDQSNFGHLLSSVIDVIPSPTASTSIQHGTTAFWVERLPSTGEVLPRKKLAVK